MAEWRAMGAGDMRAVAHVIAVAHPGYYEDTAIFAERIWLYPDGCKVLADPAGQVVGYGVAHPAMLERPPLLNCMLGALPEKSDCLHLHDVALLPEARGGGYPAQFLAMLRGLAQAAGMSWLSLIAVAGKEGYWRAQGFDVHDGDDELGRRLASYGGSSAVYMTAAL